MNAEKPIARIAKLCSTTGSEAPGEKSCKNNPSPVSFSGTIRIVEDASEDACARGASGRRTEATIRVVCYQDIVDRIRNARS